MKGGDTECSRRLQFSRSLLLLLCLVISLRSESYGGVTVPKLTVNKTVTAHSSVSNVWKVKLFVRAWTCVNGYASSGNVLHTKVNVATATASANELKLHALGTSRQAG